MDWRIWLIILSFLGIVFTIFVKKFKYGKTLARIRPYKERLLVFATPHRLEMLLLFAFLFTFFIADLAQNKFLDLGIDYMVIVMSLPVWLGGTIRALALDVWVVFLILFHLSLMALFLMSLQSKNTHRTYDVIVGILAFFGVAILLAGAIVQIYSDTIHFLFVNMASIDFYHIGVYIEIGAALYWAMTK